MEHESCDTCKHEGMIRTAPPCVDCMNTELWTALAAKSRMDDEAFIAMSECYAGGLLDTPCGDCDADGICFLDAGRPPDTTWELFVAERTHVSAMEDVCEAVDEWKAWRERNSIKAQSAHEGHLLNQLARLDKLRGK